MTIHTDTFPLVVQQTANSPQLLLRCRAIDNKIHVFLEGKHGPTAEGVDITQILSPNFRELLAKKEQPIVINLIDNSTFKHLLERLAPRDSVLL